MIYNGLKMNACHLNSFINIFLIMVPFMIIFSILFHILYLKLLSSMIISLLGFLLIFIVIMLVIGSLLISTTISQVNFINIIDPYYCHKQIYMLFYWFVVIHDIIFICILVNLVCACCAIYGFSEYCTKHNKSTGTNRQKSTNKQQK